MAAGIILAGQSEGEATVKEAAQALLPYFAKQLPKGLADHFAETFLQSVPPKKLAEAFQNVYAANGRATEVRLVRLTGPYAADIEFVFEKGVRLPATLTLEAKPPYRVVGLQFHGSVKDDDTVEAVIQEFKTLPGTAAFTVMQLGPTPEVLWEHNSDKPLAVASSFKLFILAALVEEINQGRRSWDEVVRVRKEWGSLPAGLVQDWPEGAPVTVHTLATLMISKSDNTAADHLFQLVGRQQLEAIQKVVGVQAPERNCPFLNTGELFKLKYVLSPEQQKQYLQADAAERRRWLDEVVAQTSLARPKKFGQPQLIEEVEWFFSTSDMCRVMDWLRRQKHVPEAQAILAISNSVSVDTTYWTYVGSKFGMEPGVLNFTLLVRNKAGEWLALALTWNDSEGRIEPTKLRLLAQRLIRLTQKQAS